MTTDGQKPADADGEIWLILGVSAQFQIKVFTGSAVARLFLTAAESVLMIELLLVEKVSTHRNTQRGGRKRRGW